MYLIPFWDSCFLLCFTWTQFLIDPWKKTITHQKHYLPFLVVRCLHIWTHEKQLFSHHLIKDSGFQGQLTPYESQGLNTREYFVLGLPLKRNAILKKNNNNIYRSFMVSTGKENYWRDIWTTWVCCPQDLLSLGDSLISTAVILRQDEEPLHRAHTMLLLHCWGSPTHLNKTHGRSGNNKRKPNVENVGFRSPDL